MYLADIFVCAISLAGLPAVSLPVGRSEGLAGRRAAHRAVLRGRAAARRRRRPRARGPGRRGGALMDVGDGDRARGARAARTRTKMFCACRTTFGDPPNTNVCPVCLGLPGALPVPNAEAVRLGTAAALALGCTVHPTSVFARKNYFYPDLPKGYQISQFDQPLATGGRVTFESPERGRIQVGITRLHLEEDAGKLVHDRFPGKTAVDLNRAGVPLAEIVSEPDLRSPAEARAYLTTLRQILVYAGVSECSMEQGSLRVDANISIRRPGEPRLGTKTEVKNLNSFANVERALEAERERQIALLESGGRVAQVTLLFNAAHRPGQAAALEGGEPRLPLLPRSRPAAAGARRRRGSRSGARLCPSCPRRGAAASRWRSASRRTTRASSPARRRSPTTSSRWWRRESSPRRRPTGSWATSWPRSTRPAAFPSPPGGSPSLVGLVRAGTVSHQAAKRVYAEMAQSPDGEPTAVAERLGLVQVSDQGALASWVDEVLAAIPAEVARYRGGRDQAHGVLRGAGHEAEQGKGRSEGRAAGAAGEAGRSEKREQ